MVTGSLRPYNGAPVSDETFNQPDANQNGLAESKNDSLEKSPVQGDRGNIEVDGQEKHKSAHKSIKKGTVERINLEVEGKGKMPKLSPYICFSLWIQSQLVKELGPTATIDDIARRIEYYWRNMSNEDKKSWEKAVHIRSSHNRTSTRDASEKDNIAAVESNSVHEDPALKSKQSHPETVANSIESKKPKRPVTAYIFFAKKMRALIQRKNPNMPGLDITKEIANLWSRTKEEDRAPYDKLEAESRKVYFKEMRKWKDEMASGDATKRTDERREKRKNNKKRKIGSEGKQQNHDHLAHKLDGKKRVGYQSNSTAMQHSDQRHNIGYQPDHTNHSYMHSNQYYQSQPSSYRFGQMQNVPLANAPIGPNQMGNAAANMNFRGSGGHPMNHPYYNGVPPHGLPPHPPR